LIEANSLFDESVCQQIFEMMRPLMQDYDRNEICFFFNCASRLPAEITKDVLQSCFQKLITKIFDHSRPHCSLSSLKVGWAIPEVSVDSPICDFPPSSSIDVCFPDDILQLTRIDTASMPLKRFMHL
jgi:hypothetical protein